MTDDELSPREAAEELGVTVRTVQRWIADGQAPGAPRGSACAVSRSSLSTVAERGGAADRAPRSASLLVANRGEIAVRVASTARRMGIRVVGIHAADERPPSGMDEAHAIGSYLDAAEILAVAQRAGADAIHPGYGFLAENADFARSVGAAGLAWVGPPRGRHRGHGRQGGGATTRGRTRGAGDPGLRRRGAGRRNAGARGGAHRLPRPGQALRRWRRQGHARGRRNPRTWRRRWRGARREASRSFGDDRIVLERYLAGSRHVEVQVLFDAHGAGVHLGERDCSAQRRNQKIVEEAPAPSVTPELRERIGEAALAVARPSAT